MFIHEVCKECSLTKKAVAYYIACGLLSPSVQENGYRNFSVEEGEQLKKITVLRALGLSVSDIKRAVSDKTGIELNRLAVQKRLEINLLQERQALLQELAAQLNWEQIHSQLQRLEQKQTILERLMQAFPGAYGQCLCLHFASFLQEPITTESQQAAFGTILSFLDRANFEIPAELQNELEASCQIALAAGPDINPAHRVPEMEAWIAEHPDDIKAYLAYKQSAAYQASPAYRLEKALRQFMQTSGYVEVFIPAMRQLSKTYDQYYQSLQKANEKFLESYPQIDRKDSAKSSPTDRRV